jgi:cytoskeleton protein RodZ
MTEPTPGGLTAGALLRAARERQGLHIAALAAAIKVTQRKLEALEADRHAELPDATFTRALAQTVCRTLKIDAKQVLDLLPPAAPGGLAPQSGGLNTPFRERPGREDPGLSRGAMRPLTWAALVLVLAAVVVYFLPGSLWSDKVVQALAPAPPREPAVAASAAAALAIAPDVLASAPPLPAASEPAVAPQRMPGEPVLAMPPEPPAPSAAAVSPGGIVQLRSSQASWVEVRDARGTLLLSRTLQAGEVVGLEGSLPIRLTIGNAAAVQLGFRGQPVDLAPRTRDNVARVELL